VLETVIVFNRFKTSSDALSEHKRKGSWLLDALWRTIESIASPTMGESCNILQTKQKLVLTGSLQPEICR
jgi:hypothetical protein